MTASGATDEDHGRRAVVFKICSRQDWDAAAARGTYAGSADDQRDGFIHFSARHQLAGTAAKHFRGKTGLVLVAVPADALGSSLRWEPSRGGDLFPHLYGELATAAAIAVVPLPLDAEGIPAVPKELV